MGQVSNLPISQEIPREKGEQGLRYEAPSPKRQEELIEEVAQKVHQYGMEVPAVFFTELSKPLSFVASQGLHAFNPLLGTFLNEDLIEEYAFVMEDRKNLDRFMDRVEELAHEGDRKKKWGWWEK